MNFDFAFNDFIAVKSEIKELQEKYTIEILDRNFKVVPSLINSLTTYLDNYYRDVEPREYQRFTKDLSKIKGNLVIWSTSSLLAELIELINTILEDIDVKRKNRENTTKEKEIVYADFERKYTLPQFVEEYEKVVRTNINQGNKISDYTKDLENERVKNQQLQTTINRLETKLKSNKKSVSYWLTLSVIITFFTYINFTAHLILKINFNWVVSAVAEVLLLAVFSIFFFREKAERRNIVGAVIGSIVFAALTFLAVYFANTINNG